MGAEDAQDDSLSAQLCTDSDILASE
jgi:hypothetical protein